MLISKSTKIDAGDIVSFKLVNGDEIVAKVEEVGTNEYTLNKPCVVVPSQQGLGLMQALFSTDVNVSVQLNKQHVMMSAPTLDQMQNHYIQTTTGIQPVTKGGIVT